MSAIYLRVAGRSDTGKVRSKNEDSFVIADLSGGNLVTTPGKSERFEVGDRGVLLAVSDGMGGEKAGEVASALVVETLTRSMSTAPLDHPSRERITRAVDEAHSTVREAAAQKGNRMGATLTAVYVHGASAYVVEVGDSRAYLVRADGITQLTKDQSYVQLLMDAGTLKPENVESSPFRNVILQAMGHGAEVHVELGKLALRSRDCLLLCSDGLFKHVKDDEIRHTVLTSADLSIACDRLISLANERGGEDNITVVIAGAGGALPPSQKGEDVAATYEVLQSFEK